MIEHNGTIEIIAKNRLKSGNILNSSIKELIKLIKYKGISSASFQDLINEINNPDSDFIISSPFREEAVKNIKIESGICQSHLFDIETLESAKEQVSLEVYDDCGKQISQGIVNAGNLDLNDPLFHSDILKQQKLISQDKIEKYSFLITYTDKNILDNNYHADFKKLIPKKI